MINKISKSDKIKLPKLEMNWSVEQQEKFDEQLEEMQRLSRHKQAMSEIESSKIFLD